MKNLLYISILAFLFSCTKGGGNVYIEGRFYNPITGEGISGAEIALCRDKIGGMLGAQSSGIKAVELAHTDENGYYHIKHSGISSYFIRLMSLGDYAGIGWVNIHTKNKTYSANGVDVKVHLSKNMHADFQAVPYGYLKLSIHNVNCQGGGDIITIDMQPTYLEDYSAIQPLTENGCYDNDFIESKVPSGTWEATWQVTKNGMLTNYDTTFFIPENGHYHLTINY